MIEVESNSDVDVRVNGAVNAIEAIAKQAKIEVEGLHDELNELRVKLLEAQPKVEFAENISTCENVISLNQFASVFYDEFKLGRNSLFDLLRDSKILISSKSTRNKPYQEYIKRGYFVVTTRIINGRMLFQPLLSSKGMLWLFQKVRKLLDEKNAHED